MAGSFMSNFTTEEIVHLQEFGRLQPNMIAEIDQKFALELDRIERAVKLFREIRDGAGEGLALFATMISVDNSSPSAVRSALIAAVKLLADSGWRSDE